MIKLTLEDTIRYLDEAIEFRGSDYVDPNFGLEGQCVYSDERGFRCGVGEVLARAGVTDVTLREADRRVCGAHELREAHAFTDVIDVDEDAVKFLAEFQSNQDLGQSWGYARAQALSVVEVEEYTVRDYEIVQLRGDRD